MPVPVILGVGIRAERAEMARDGDESLQSRRNASGPLGQRCVAHVEQRFPVLYPAWLLRELRMIPEPIIDRGGVAEDERRVQRRRRNARIEREESFRPADRAAGSAADELVDGGIERQRTRLDLFTQRVPGWESVLARHCRLRIVQRKIRSGNLIERFAFQRGQGGEAPERVEVARLCRAEQRLCLFLQVFEVRTGGQFL